MPGAGVEMFAFKVLGSPEEGYTMDAQETGKTSWRRRPRKDLEKRKSATTPGELVERANRMMVVGLKASCLR